MPPPMAALPIAVVEMMDVAVPAAVKVPAIGATPMAGRGVTTRAVIGERRRSERNGAG